MWKSVRWRNIGRGYWSRGWRIYSRRHCLCGRVTIKDDKYGKKKILEFQNISKSFVGVKALSDVSFSVREGEVHALLGENGAGKSTLMKILSGAYMKDAGKVFLDGQEIQVKNTKESERLGISIIYQELNLIPELSVAENIFWIASQRETVLLTGSK